MKWIVLLPMLLVLAGCEERQDGVEISTTVEQEETMNEPFDIDAYLEKAGEHLKAQTRGHEELWRIGEARWDADQETGILTWSFDDGRKVEASFQIVGTYSTKSGTFLWGWDNPSVLEPMAEDARAVKAFGEKHDIDFLQWRKLDCDEESAWELAALANLLCERQGVYGGPAGDARVFMTFGEVKISGPAE